MTIPAQDELLFLALGGSGEIGMNVNLYGTGGQWLMVDMGMTFAGTEHPGVDVVLPDLQFVEERRRALAGIVLTHGHEDHIGAIPYLVQDLGVPIWATPFTAGLVRAKLDEEGIADQIELNVVEPGGSFRVGPFGLTYLPVAHSIAEANALLIETPLGRVVHTGDWKLDPEPLIVEPTSEAEWRGIGDEGVLALVCDSTNIFNARATGSEASCFEGLRDVVAGAEGRVLVTTFASNVARLGTLGRVAEATGRRLCVAGRSLERIIRVAQATGYLQDLPPLVDMEAAMRLPPDRVLIVATGGQGEPRAALARIAGDSHPIRLSTGDLVIFSSRQIPGNELAIGRIENQLAARGVALVTAHEAPVHVSGHPGRPEIAQLYEWIRPRIAVPVHGEMRHLAEHGRFAMAQGVRHAVVQANGSMIRLAPGAPALVSHERVGRLALDGDVILPMDGGTINERRKLAINGLVTVAAAVDGRRRMVGRPSITAHGLPVEEDRASFVADAEEAARTAVSRGERDRDRLAEAVRLAVRRVATEWTGKKPIVIVNLVEI